MIWSFERRNQLLLCEIRREPDGQHYEFVVTRPDGVEEAERFDDASAVIAKSVDFMRTLIEDGWRTPQAAAASRDA